MSFKIQGVGGLSNKKLLHRVNPRIGSALGASEAWKRWNLFERSNHGGRLINPPLPWQTMPLPYPLYRSPLDTPPSIWWSPESVLIRSGKTVIINSPGAMITTELIPNNHGCQLFQWFGKPDSLMNGNVCLQSLRIIKHIKIRSRERFHNMFQ